MNSKKWFCLYLLLTFLLSGCERSLTFEEYVKKAENDSAGGNYEKAIDAYKKALQLKPGDLNTHYALASSYDQEWRAVARKGAWNSAELKTYNAKLKELSGLATTEYKKVIEVDHANWRARYFVATDHMNNKRYNEAITEYGKVIKFNPKLAVAYSQLGEANLQIGYCNSAIHNFKKAFNLDSDTERYYLDVGRVYVKMNDPEKTREMISHLKGSQYLYDLTRYQPNGKCSSSEGLPLTTSDKSE